MKPRRSSAASARLSGSPSSSDQVLVTGASVVETRPRFLIPVKASFSEERTAARPYLFIFDSGSFNSGSFTTR